MCLDCIHSLLIPSQFCVVLLPSSCPINPVSATHVVLDVWPSTGAGQPTLGNLHQEN